MKRWYVVTTYSGFENSVKQDLERRMESMNMTHLIYQVLVPEEVEEVTDKKGNVKQKVNKMFPGYVFVEMEVEGEMDEKAWFMVRNTPGVTGFVGSSGGGTKPFPIPREEIEPVLKRMNIEDADMYSDYEVGDVVRVLSGTFEGSEGKIDIVDTENSEVTISIIFFGRTTPITVKFSEIEKI